MKINSRQHIYLALYNVHFIFNTCSIPSAMCVCYVMGRRTLCMRRIKKKWWTYFLRMTAQTLEICSTKSHCVTMRVVRIQLAFALMRLSFWIPFYTIDTAVCVVSDWLTIQLKIWCWAMQADERRASIRNSRISPSGNAMDTVIANFVLVRCPFLYPLNLLRGDNRRQLQFIYVVGDTIPSHFPFHQTTEITQSDGYS